MSTTELPKHLQGEEARGICEEGQAVAQFEVGGMSNFTYLILDWRVRQALILDPQKELEPVLSAVVGAHGFKLRAVLLTHGHSDHTAGVPLILGQFPDADVYLHHDDHKGVRRLPKDRLKWITDGEELAVLPGFRSRIRVLHTPGHTPGSCSFLLETDERYLFTGDTVFLGDCGRTDLPGGSTVALFESLGKLRGLPAETIVLPGHHYSPPVARRLEEELRLSRPFGCKSVEELEALP